MSKQKQLSQHDIARIAAEAGAQAGVKAYEQEKVKAQKDRVDRRLHNTRLLLRKYRVFKLHAERAVFAMEKADDIYSDVFDILDEISGYSDSLYVESIQRSAQRTHIIVKHIDTMLDMYHIYCNRSRKPEDMRHYRVITGLYIDNKELTAAELAEQEGIDERTVYKDRDKAVGILSGLFFGIDSMGII